MTDDGNRTSYENHHVYLWLGGDERLYNVTREIVNRSSPYRYKYKHHMINELTEWVKSLQDDGTITEHITTYRINFYELALDFIYEKDEIHEDYYEEYQERREWLTEHEAIQNKEDCNHRCSCNCRERTS